MATVLALWILLSVCSTWTEGQYDDDLHRYSNLWVAKVEGGEEVAKRVARDLGYTYNGQCGELEGYYEFTREDLPEMSFRDSGHLTSDLLDLDECGELEGYYEFTREDVPEMTLRDSDHLTSDLLDLDEVKWAQQQSYEHFFSEDDSRGDIEEPGFDNHLRFELPKKSMDFPLLAGHSNFPSVAWEVNSGESFIRRGPNEVIATEDFYKEQNYLISFLKDQGTKVSQCKSIFSCVSEYPPRTNTYLDFLKFRGQSDLSQLGTFSTKPAPSSQLSEYSKVTTRPIDLLSLKVSAYILKHSDPYWNKQWNLQDYRTVDMPVMDLNVVPVHDRGITGEGIIVGVVDTGVEHDNFDIGDNFISRLSYDYCRRRKGSHPRTSDSKKSHGTNSAGVIAMKPDNGKCGVGIAYKAKVVGIRAICYGFQLWSTTGKALVHGIKEIDIYTNSWSTNTKGKILIKRDHLKDRAFLQGSRKGRNNKGAIYVKSAGNEKHIGDNCAFDINVNSPYVIAIASASQTGHTVYNSERCTAIFATAYSKSRDMEGIVAPSINGECIPTFSGTSAACPQASGIIALVLNANRQLTYRDVMHLITMSAEVAPLADNPNTWYKNGRGFWVSNDFGFGLMNAENMVNLAEKWKNVPEKRECRVTIELGTIPISLSKDVDVPFDATACSGTVNEVRYLEQIEISPWVKFQVRGDINIYITSPSGTVTKLLESRDHDNKPSSLSGINIVSTHNWGEEAQGRWLVKFTINKSSTLDPKYTGYVKDFTVTFHGTKDKPAHYVTDRTYAAFRLPDGTTS